MSHLMEAGGHPWLRVITDGHLAVVIFFVLSGFALTVKFVRRPDQFSLPHVLAARIVRLTLPIFAACVLSYLLMRGSLLFNHEPALGATHPEYLPFRRFFNFQPSIASLVQFSFVSVLVNYHEAQSYHPSLWIMPYEFKGSVLIYLYVGVYALRQPPSRAVKILLVVPFCVIAYKLLGYYGLCFLIGHGFAELYESRFRAHLLVSTAATVLLPIPLLADSFVRLSEPAYLVVAAAIVFCAVFGRAYNLALSTKVSRFVGQLSFPIYLVHVSVICSFTFGLLLILQQHGISAAIASGVIVPLSVIVVVAVARLFLPIERLSIHLSHRVGAWAAYAARWLRVTGAPGGTPQPAVTD